MNDKKAELWCLALLGLAIVACSLNIGKAHSRLSNLEESYHVNMAKVDSNFRLISDHCTYISADYKVERQ